MILSLLALAAAIVLAVGIVSLTTGERAGGVILTRQTVQLVGYCLLSVASIGLWSWRPWGFWTLGLATAVTLFATLPEGMLAVIWRSFLHWTMILLISEHYFARKEAAEEEHTSDHSH